MTCSRKHNKDGTGDEAYGIEVRGVYDGVLIFQCPECGNMWPRFTEGPLRDKARQVIARWDEIREEGRL